jgi:hypothetical protein
MQTTDGRIPPRLPVTAMKTYTISAPLATHWNTVTCGPGTCEWWATGWDTVIDERTGLGRRQAQFIRADRERRFTEEREESGLTRFRFGAGQRCFKGQHLARNMREDTYAERGGDHRAVIGRPRVHKNAGEWVESFAENQDRVKTITDRG